jgi:hypothetical protein
MPDVRRLGRILVGIVRGVSLGLCVAALALWVRSYRGGGETITMVGRAAEVELVSSRGGLMIETYRGWTGGSEFRWVRGESPLRAGTGKYETCGRAWGGFGMGCAVSSGGAHAVAHRWVRVPHWYAAVVFGVVAMGRAALRVRR